MTDGRPVGRFEWERIVRRIDVPASVKLTALILASYADTSTGMRTHPGLKRLTAVTGTSRRTVIRSLEVLRDLGLIERTFHASRSGGKADEYRLTVPLDLSERAPMLGPDEGQGDGSASPQVPSRPPGSVDNPDDQVPPEQPASDGQMPNKANQVPPETEPGATSAPPPPHAPTQKPSATHEGFCSYRAEEEDNGERPETGNMDSSSEEREFAEARRLLESLPDLGSHWTQLARNELGAGCSLHELMIHAAELARTQAA